MPQVNWRELLSAACMFVSACRFEVARATFRTEMPEEPPLSGSDRLPDEGWAAPASLLGMLQRGRGLGLQRALELRAVDEVLTCLGQNAWRDRQLEERGWYMARLVRDLGIPLSALPWDAAAPEMAESVVFDALLELAAMGSVEAAAMLHAHVSQAPVDQVAELALTLWNRGGAAARRGLRPLVLARLGDAALAAEVWPGEDGPWDAWSDDPRVAGALAARRLKKASRIRAVREPRRDLRRETSDALMQLLVEAQPHESRTRVLREIGRRGATEALDLLERPDLRNASGWAPRLTAVARTLGAQALPRARAWMTSGDPYLERVAEEVIADHGVREDVPTVVALFGTAVASSDWLLTEPLAAALGRLSVTSAREALLAAWVESQHSHARAAYLRALSDLQAPDVAELMTEAVDDCESEVRELVSTLAGT